MFFKITENKILKWKKKRNIAKLVSSLRTDEIELFKFALDSLIDIGDKVEAKVVTDALFAYLKKIKGEKQAVDKLLFLFNNPELTSNKYFNDNIRYKVIEALGETGDTRSVEPLIEHLGELHSDSISNALAKIDNDKAKFYALYDAREYRFNEEVIINFPQAFDSLMEALYHKSSIIRTASIRALVLFKDKRAVEPLMKLLYECNSKIEESMGEKSFTAEESIIYAILEVLPQMETKGLTDPFLSIINNQYYSKCRDDGTSTFSRHYCSPRVIAVKELGELKDTKAIEPLVNILRQMEYECIVKASAQALEKIRKVQPSKIISDALIHLFQNKEEWFKPYPDFALAFDIDALGGGTYGLNAWSAVWKHCDAEKAVNTVLFEGDSSSTLKGFDRTYLCAFYGLDEKTMTSFKEAMDKSKETAYLGCVDQEATNEPLAQTSFIRKSDDGNIIIEDNGTGWAARGLEKIRRETAGSHF